MIYKFPIIEHIDQVLPFIKDSPEFGVYEKDGGYTVITYHVSTPETFPDDNPELAAIRRECRGIAFHTKTGKLISRPYHKFFNLNERAETLVERVPFHLDHVLLEKLDGSMIRPLFLDSGLRWGTKAGVTDVSMQAECWILEHPEYIEAVEDFRGLHATPLFEWCSRSQKIVLDYPKDRLVLTGIRYNDTGEYWNLDSLIHAASVYRLDHVKPWCPSHKDLFLLAEEITGLENTEGYVMRFHSGHMLKVKCQWYMNLHRAKEALMQERHLVEMILDEKLDDVYAALPPEDQSAINIYQDIFSAGVSTSVSQLKLIYSAYEGLTRKDFALERNTNLGPLFKALVFKQFDGKDVREELLKAIRNGLGSNKRFETVRPLFGSPTPWKGLMNGRPEDTEDS